MTPRKLITEAEITAFNEMLGDEEWRYVTGSAGYIVSESGRVASLFKTTLSDYRNITRNGKLLIQENDKCGYKKVRYILDGHLKSRKDFVHRLLAKEFIANPESKKEVNHKNGIKFDNRKDNLEWVTRQENALHSYRTGLQIPLRGEGLTQSKLKKVDIPKIRLEYKRGNISLGLLGSKYKVSGGCIRKVVKNESWNHD
jgi:hypothetical protein